MTQSSSSSTPEYSLTQLVLLAGATAGALGYDVGIMAAAIQPLQADMGLTNVQKEVATGSLNFVAAFGAMLGGHVANAHGRKATIQLCGWLFVVGTIGMALAPNFLVLLLLGRIVTGMGVGVSFVVAPMFLSEVAPSERRGELNTVFDVAINGGILMGYIVGFLIELLPFLSDSLKWRTMLGLGIVLPIVILYNLAKLPESPRYLVMKQETKHAQEVLTKIGESDPEGTVEKIQKELRNAPHMHSAGEILAQLFTGKASFGIKLAMGMGIWQQITGTEAVLYYSADFLRSAGLQSDTQRLLGNVFVGVSKLAPELYAMYIVDKVGRRPLMLASGTFMAFFLALLASAFHWDWGPIPVVLLLCSFMASFSIGLGPFTLMMASEVLGLNERASGMTLCAAVDRLTSGTVAMTSVSLYQALTGSGFFFAYSVVGWVMLPFFFVYLPETSGASLEELSGFHRGDADDDKKKSTSRRIHNGGDSSKAKYQSVDTEDPQERLK